MAERIGAAVLIVRHLNKSEGNNPLYRGGGSIGFVGAARSGLLAALDPDDESGNSRVLAATKSNLGPRPASLKYSIEPHEDSIRIYWQGESRHGASALLAVPSGEEARSAVEEAEEFLRSYLDDGSVAADEALRDAHKAGFSDRTIDRARKILGVRSRRDGFGQGSEWLWELAPKSASASAKSAITGNLAPFEQPTDSTHFESTTSPKSAKQNLMAPYGDDLAPFEEGEL
jgi:hypothetical protein